MRRRRSTSGDAVPSSLSPSQELGRLTSRAASVGFDSRDRIGQAALGE